MVKSKIANWVYNFSYTHKDYLNLSASAMNLNPYRENRIAIFRGEDKIK